MLANRLELKYYVDRTTRTGFARDLRALMQPDEHSGEDGSYRVRSLYFDSPDYVAYHDKLAGLAVRHKCRVRTYGEDPTRVPFVRFEVKSRYIGIIKKVTALVRNADYPEIERGFSRRLLPPRRLLDEHPGLLEFFRLQKTFNLEPKIIVQYRREAFERSEQGRIRVNFDDELVANRSVALLGELPGARRLLRPGHSIFEIKVDGPMPSWMHMLISKYNLMNRAISKYCVAVRSEAMLSAVSRQGD